MKLILKKTVLWIRIWSDLEPGVCDRIEPFGSFIALSWAEKFFLLEKFAFVRIQSRIRTF
jgi:hypothetical protein